MATLQSTIPLIYDARSGATAIIQIETQPLIKLVESRNYRVDIIDYKLIDDGAGMIARQEIYRRPPLYYSFEEVDALKIAFKQGAQITCDQEEELIESLLLNITMQDPVYLSDHSNWEIFKSINQL